MTNAQRNGFSQTRHVCLFSLLLCLCLIGVACGGGSGSGGGQTTSPPPPPAPSPDFTLSLNPASISVPIGGSATTSLLATAANGFSSQVTVSAAGVPSGVSISPSSITLTPGTAQQVTVSAQSGTAAASVTMSFVGTSGSLAHSVSLTIDLYSSVGGAGTLSTRTNYVRSDAVTEYFQWLNTHWMIYNQSTSRFFVTDPLSSSVMAFDSSTEKKIATIPVPGAYGIDQTADGSTLYVGTLIGNVYTLDPVGMKVTHRYIASQIGPYGFGSAIALPLSNGTVALLGSLGGIPSVDGSSDFAVWNPANNSIKIYGASLFGGVPTTPLCSTMGNIGGFALTADRTAVVVGSIDSDETVCEVDPSTGQMQGIKATGFTSKITTSPDGRYIALLTYTGGNNSGQLNLYDQHTLALAAQFTISGDASSASNIVFSPDSQTLFVSSEAFVYAYSVATHQQVGWFPNIVVDQTSSGYTVSPAANPTYEAEDSTGLLAGPLEEGIGFLDTTQMQTGTVAAPSLNGYLNPATGPTSGGTVTQWNYPNSTVTTPKGVYFGANLSPSFSVANGTTVTATTPPGNPGPADVRLFTGDGGLQMLPEAYSYGPTILEVTPNMSTTDGGGPGVIYGYGFGPTETATIPSDLAITVGGKRATITAYNGNAYGIIGQPFPLEAVYYTIPPGTTGAADVLVATTSGTATAHAAMTYIPAAKQYPLSGASLAQGIYDPLTNVYYFTDASKIQVFSLAQQQWLPPIPIPAPSGATQRLWGISLSPDGSKLAVADIQANVIYLLDPANPTSVQTFPFTPSYPSGIISHPAGIAVSDSGVVYIAAYIEGGTGFDSFFSLDTSTGTLTDYGIAGPQNFVNGVPQDVYLRTALSADGTRVYFNDDGYVFNVDTATGKLFSATSDVGCCYGDYDLALAPNQTQLEASSYLYDSDLNAQSFFTLNDREMMDISYVYGVKFSPDGSLLFQPSPYGIDVYDGHLGKLLNRIALPFQLSSNYDALVSDGVDNVLLAITGSGDGIAVLDLTSLPEPPPLTYATARSSRLQSTTQRAWSPATTAPSTQIQRGINPAKPGIHVIPHVTHVPAGLSAPSHDVTYRHRGS
jgi:hypothetical protein